MQDQQMLATRRCCEGWPCLQRLSFFLPGRQRSGGGFRLELCRCTIVQWDPFRPTPEKGILHSPAKRMPGAGVSSQSTPWENMKHASYGETFESFLQELQVKNCGPVRCHLQPRMMPVAEWMGVENSQLPSVFPNIAAFNSSLLMTGSTLFVAS